MAHEDIVRIGAIPGEPSSSGGPKFDSLNFLENLPTVLKSGPSQPFILDHYYPGWNTINGDERTYQQGLPERVLSVLLGNFYATTTLWGDLDEFFNDRDFSDFDEFISEFRDWAIDVKGSSSTFLNVNFLHNSIYRDYLSSLNVAYNMQLVSFGPENMGVPNFAGVTDPEWDLIQGLIKGSIFDNGGLFDQMKNAFTHFLQTTSKSERTTRVDFFDAWFSYLSSTAHFSDSTDPSNPSSAIDMAAYEKIYIAFFGNDPNDFKDRLNTFYDKVLDETGNGDPAKGWFIPSHSFSQWFEDIRDEYLKSIGTGQFKLTTVSLPEFNEDGTKNFKSARSLLTIDRILKLLVYMIDVLQRISALQANYLGFLTDWQKRYTDHLNEIPVFTEGDGSLLAGIVEGGPRLQTPPGGGAKYVNAGGDPYSDTEASETNTKVRFQRAETNTEMQALQEKIRGNRGLIQDAAKQMQTTINQSQDGANQQVQMATALLQQLGTIISQIFR